MHICRCSLVSLLMHRHKIACVCKFFSTTFATVLGSPTSCSVSKACSCRLCQLSLMALVLAVHHIHTSYPYIFSTSTDFLCWLFFSATFSHNKNIDDGFCATRPGSMNTPIWYALMLQAWMGSSNWRTGCQASSEIYAIILAASPRFLLTSLVDSGSSQANLKVQNLTRQ